MAEHNEKRVSRRDFLRYAGTAATSAAAAGPLARLAFTQEGADLSRPNIILIMADDLGWADIGCYGSEIDTPHIDSLAEDGIRFTQFYNTGKCFPSRACAITGVYAQQCGMGNAPTTIENAATIGEVLGGAGYRTLWSGKHHGRENPYERGFDHYYGLRDGACNYFNPGRKRENEPEPAQKKRGRRVWCIDGETHRPYTPEARDFYTTDTFTDYALDWLDAGRDDDQPFFLYLAYNAPHDPLHAWPRDIAKYEGVYDIGYGAIRRARYARQCKMGLVDPETAPLSRDEHPDWEKLDEAGKRDQTRRVEVYAAMIDSMDQNIGRVLKKLRDMGVEENTLVMFCSDNGANPITVEIRDGPIGAIDRWSSLGQPWANVGNTPLRKYKNWSHEGGVCSPMVARWPAGIRGKGRITHWPGHFIDFLATFVDITGAEYPEQLKGEEVVPLQGQSFLPVLRGDGEPKGRTLFWEWKGGRAVRRDDWKLVRKRGPWELYNMAKDRTETNNVVKEHPEMANELARAWEEWYSECYGGNPPEFP